MSSTGFSNCRRTLEDQARSKDLGGRRWKMTYKIMILLKQTSIRADMKAREHHETSKRNSDAHEAGNHLECGASCAVAVALIGLDRSADILACNNLPGGSRRGCVLPEEWKALFRTLWIIPVGCNSYRSAPEMTERAARIRWTTAWASNRIGQPSFRVDMKHDTSWHHRISPSGFHEVRWRTVRHETY